MFMQMFMLMRVAAVWRSSYKAPGPLLFMQTTCIQYVICILYKFNGNIQDTPRGDETHMDSPAFIDPLTGAGEARETETASGSGEPQPKVSYSNIKT